MKITTKILLSGVTASILLIGCGNSSSSSSSSTSTTETVSGTAVDGPVAYAKVCLDLNFNGKCDSNEKEFNTSAEGKFTITYNVNEKNASIAPVLVVPTINSYDTSTGNSFTITMSAPRAGQNQVIVSPLTTVAAQAVYNLKDQNKTVNEVAINDVISKVSKAVGVNNVLDSNPVGNSKLLITAVTLAKVIKKDGNISKVADSIVEENETNITAALPADYQNIYAAAISAVDENTSINPDLLQQAVENAVDNNNSSYVSSVVNSDGNETAVAEALVGGYLNSVKADLNESGVTIYLNGNSLNFDFNASETALELYNDYNITDVSSLNEKYNSKDLNTSEVNVTALLQTYNLLEKARVTLKNSGITRSFCYIDGSEQVYFDLNTGEKIDVPENTFNFKYNDVTQVIAYDSDTVAVVDENNSKIYIAGLDGSKTYDNIKSFTNANYDTVISALTNINNDLNASLVKSSYTVTYTVDGKTESTVYNVDPSNPVYYNDALKFDDGVHYFINTTDMNNSDYTSMSGYLATVDSNGYVTSLLPAKAVYYNANLQSFLSKLDFTPAAVSSVGGEKFIMSEGTPIYFTSDGRYFSVGGGTYEIEDNVLVLYDDGIVSDYIAFKNFNADGSCDYVWYSVKDNETYSGTLTAQPYDEYSYIDYFTPMYNNNGSYVTLAADDDIMNFDQNGNIQFTIEDDTGTGIQCTTNFTNIDDFKNAFVNGELTLNAADGNISCLYLNNGTAETAENQTEEIKFIDNNDGTYQVYMTSGYFSGSDYNITDIEDSLLTTEFTTTATATSTSNTSTITDVNSFINALDFTPVSITAGDLNGTTINTEAFGNYQGFIQLDTNGSFTDNEVDENNTQITESGTWEVNNSVLVLNYENNDTVYVAVKDMNGSVIDVTGYDSEDGGMFTDTGVILNKGMGATLTSLDDFNNLFKDGTPAVNITTAYFNDTNWTATMDGINFKTCYNSDGSFFETWSVNGNEENITGTWEVNETENVLIIKADNYATSLVRVIDANSTSAKTVSVNVDANGTILGIGALIFNKVQ